MVTRRLLTAYILLVGLPLITLLTILRAGSRLEAPVSVGGQWILRVNQTPTGDTHCKELLETIGQPFISIAQSGGKLLFNLNDRAGTVLPGDLRGGILTMGLQGGLRTAALCSDPQSIYLQANVTKQGSARSMAGILGFRGCDSCAPVSFQAVRETPRAVNGGE